MYDLTPLQMSDNVVTVKPWKIISHIICLAIVAIPIPVLKYHGIPTKRGFYCDSSIRYPYHESTISTGVASMYCFTIPALCVLIGEYLNQRRQNTLWSACAVSGKTISSYIVHIYRIYGTFLFGAACSHFLTDIAKYSVGRLRPHFLSVCQPYPGCSAGVTRYIEDYTCTGSNEFRIRESRLSFISGHASLTAYAMMYAALYLQLRCKFKDTTFIRIIIQYFLIVLAIFTAMSRVMDYKHHPGDVIAGAIEGTVMALIMIFFVSGLIPSRNKQKIHEQNEMTAVVNHTNSA